MNKVLPIHLNFYPLSKQEFTFRVYRQNFDGQPRMEGAYKAKLPTSNSLEEYNQYWVSLDLREGFERFYCTSQYNPFLTVHIIWECFLRHIRNILTESEYLIRNKSINDRKVSIIIGTHQEGQELINIQPYYLESEKKFGFLVDFSFKQYPNTPYSLKIQQLSLSLNKNGQSNTDYYSDKYDKIQVFLQKYRQRLFPFQINSEDFDIQKEMLRMKSYSLATKRYIFGNGCETNSQFKGIKDFGPFRTVDKEPLFVFLFKQEQRDAANQLYKALVGSDFPVTFPGMEKMFKLKLEKSNVTKIPVESLSPQHLSSVASHLDELKNQNPEKHLVGVFLINREADGVQKNNFSPYYFLKFIFTDKHIPLQTVTLEKIEGRDGLKWSASNIGLGIFSKMGGIPWKVKPSNNKCLIFGLGAAHKKDEQGKINKYFAYSVCMDSTGIYKKINVLGDAQDRPDYIHQLKENIKTVIAENIDDNIEKCVLHLPFKIRNDEMNYLRQSVNEIASLYADVEFQFIKINTENKYFGYADNNNKIPYESSFIQLSTNQFLVWFEGLQYGKEFVKNRTGNPVHIEFLQIGELTPEKKQSYLQDIINLSGANWRGFNSKLMPISIFYPKIIADFISEFRQLYPDRDVNLTNFEIPWFL